MSRESRDKRSELMGVRTIIQSSCKNRKSALYSSLAGQTRSIFEPLSSYGVFSIGMTRLFLSLSIVHSAHLLSSSYFRKSTLLIPWNSGPQNEGLPDTPTFSILASLPNKVNKNFSHINIMEG